VELWKITTLLDSYLLIMNKDYGKLQHYLTAHHAVLEVYPDGKDKTTLNYTM
jgi:hypothetical protein